MGYGGHALGHATSLLADMVVQMLCESRSKKLEFVKVFQLITQYDAVYV